ncbi:MAG TPA: radical SAM protein [Chloroflexia bacterium]|nr:radical SAM protein [Chloroflexia bacterium]
MIAVDKPKSANLIRRPLPRSLYIEPTNRCNSLCTTCPRTFFPMESPADMSFERFKSIVDQFPVLERVVLHGLGEPMLNHDLARMIEYLKARPEGTYVLYNSNSIAMTPRRAEDLVASGLDEYRASLDGATPETYRAIRGVDALDKVVRNLRLLVETKQRMGAAAPHVSAWFIAMRENLHELLDVIRLTHEVGIGEFYMQRFVYFGEGLGVEEQSLYRRLKDEERTLVEQAEELCRELGMKFQAAGATTPVNMMSGAATPGGYPTPQSSRPWSECRRPTTLSYITANGNVLSCCFVPFASHDYAQMGDLILGNAFERPFEEIWNGAAYGEFRRRILTDDPARCCKGCGSKWSL